MSSYLPFQIDKIKIVLGHSTFDALTITMTMAMMAQLSPRKPTLRSHIPLMAGRGIRLLSLRCRICNARRSVVVPKCNNSSIILDFAASRLWFDFLLRNGTYANWCFPQWPLVLVNTYTLLANLKTGRLPDYSYLVQNNDIEQRAPIDE